MLQFRTSQAMLQFNTPHVSGCYAAPFPTELTRLLSCSSLGARKLLKPGAWSRVRALSGMNTEPLSRVYKFMAWGSKGGMLRTLRIGSHT